MTTDPLQFIHQSLVDLWVDQYSDLLYRYAWVRVRNLQAAEELVEQTLQFALESYANDKDQLSLQNKLTHILKKKLIVYFKAQAKVTDLEVEWVECFENRSSLSKSETIFFENIQENKTFQMKMNSCLLRLPLQLQQIIILREGDAFSTRELCEIFGLTPNLLWVTLHRIRYQLKKCLIKNETYSKNN